MRGLDAHIEQPRWHHIEALALATISIIGERRNAYDAPHGRELDDRAVMACGLPAATFKISQAIAAEASRYIGEARPQGGRRQSTHRCWRSRRRYQDHRAAIIMANRHHDAAMADGRHPAPVARRLAALLK